MYENEKEKYSVLIPTSLCTILSFRVFFTQFPSFMEIFRYGLLFFVFHEKCWYVSFLNVLQHSYWGHACAIIFNSSQRVDGKPCNFHFYSDNFSLSISLFSSQSANEQFVLQASANSLKVHLLFVADGKFRNRTYRGEAKPRLKVVAEMFW